MNPRSSLVLIREPGSKPCGARSAAPAVFSTELRDLVARFGDRAVRLEDILEATQGRGTQLLLVLIALPFVGPIPLPGFSLPFGFVVTLLGARMALAKQPWLPRRLLRQEWPARTLGKWIQAASRIMAGLEYFLRPRLLFVPEHAVFSRLAGLLIAVSGLMLMLPFPLPFSNSLPAWTVLFLAAGALGRDGLFFFVGCTSFALSVAFFTLIAVGGAEALDALRRLLSFH